jgi:ankyrin repeat protein
VNINYQGYANWSALMPAALTGSAETVAFLLDHGADPNIRDAQGKTALRLAIESKHDRMKELLLQRGARE